MSHEKWHFPFAFTPVEKKAKQVTEGWMANLKTTILPSHLVKWKELDRWLFTKPTWDGAATLQALRMINGFANLARLQTQMRTELIAMWNTLAWRKRKCRHAKATHTKKKLGHLLLWTPKGPLLTRVQLVSINHGLLTAETTLSHQHAMDWMTDSILNTLGPDSGGVFLFNLPPSWTHRKWKPSVQVLLCIM